MISLTCLITIIIGHFLFDWYLQPRAVAKKKTTDIKWMLKHLMTIQVGFMIIALFFGVSQWLVLLNTISHGIIDKTVWTQFRKHCGPFTDEYLEKNLYAEDKRFYDCIALDQTLHLCILVLIFQG